MFKVKTRPIIGVMLFFATFTQYLLRVNFSVIILAMVKNVNKTNPDYGPRYKWSGAEQSSVLGAYYYTYAIGSIFAGTVAEKIGARLVIGVATLLSGILTLIAPFVAGENIILLFILRLLIGLGGATVYPSCHCLIAKWSPPDEKGKFVATLMGGTMGTVITLASTGIIIENISWAAAFYIQGVFSIVFTIIWFILVTDSPNNHWLINEDEQTYILDSLKQNTSNVKKIPPYISILTSMPYLALVILHYGNMSGLTFAVTYVPMYMSQVLNFNIKKAGFLSSLPSLLRFVFAFIFGAIVDAIRHRELLSTTTVRKSFCLASHFIPGILLIVLGIFGNNTWFVVFLMSMSLGFNGSAVATNLQNAQDLAPNYAGTLYGLMNSFGNLSGIVITQVVAYFTRDRSTKDEWAKIFIFGGFTYIIPAIVFIFFGSGNVQKWNFSKENN